MLLPLAKERSGVAVPEGERGRGETELEGLSISADLVAVRGGGCAAMGLGCISVQDRGRTEMAEMDLDQRQHAVTTDGEKDGVVGGGGGGGGDGDGDGDWDLRG